MTTQYQNMKQIYLSYLFFLSIILSSCQINNSKTEILEPSEEEKTPFDWMYNQRAYPHNHIDMEAYWEGMEQTLAAKNTLSARDNESWELAGPLNTGGRITDILLHPTDTNIIYAGASVGGIWKSEDGGEDWSPIFETKGILTIGDLAITPQNTDIIWAGTGEANGSATSGAFFGNGVYRSTNGGDTWVHKGLDNTQHIGRIAVNQNNLNNVFVAAAGALYEKNDDRGLYRTNDGGETWEQVLFVSDSTSVIDVAIHPAVPNWIYAVTWERLRYPWQRSYGGVTSGIWRSQDGGDTWEKLENGLPPSGENVGRIGIHFAQSNSVVLYASYTTNAVTNYFDGIYKSSNSGDSWERVDEDPLIEDVYGGFDGIGGFGWFFGNVRVDPNDQNRMFILGVQLMMSENGGQTYVNVAPDNHVDNHGLEIHPMNSDFMVSGNDGGIYITKNGGESWTHVETLPITQFYNGEIDFLNPDRIYGGTQDNGTIRTPTGGLDNWQRILGGDGFHVNVHPQNSDILFAEFQNGVLFRSLNDANQMEFIFNGGDDDRTNWNTPVILDPNNPSTIYYGANVLHRSEDLGDNWVQISPDLTDGQHPSGSLSFGTITTIAVAPTNSDVIYVGTDDGNVQVSLNNGDDWTNVSAGLPDRYITSVAVDPLDELTVYVTLSGYRYIDYQPHVLRSTNAGQDWEDISGNLPEIPVNDIVIDPDFDDTYYIANDLNVWVTIDAGLHWYILEPTLPSTVVNQLVLHPETRKLLAVTFGRSMHTLDMSDFVPTKEIVKNDDFELNISPNPIADFAKINLKLPNEVNGKLELYAINGQYIRTIFEGDFSKGRQEYDLEIGDLAAGNYLVRFVSKEKILVGKVQRI